MARTTILTVPLIGAAIGIAIVVSSRDEGAPTDVQPEHAPAAAVAASVQTPRAVELDERDRTIFHETMAWARAERLDTLPLGEIIVLVGQRFVDTPYVPGTLDVEGEERLVVNLRGLDCVTYVENVLAISRLIQRGQDDFDAFLAELARIRYRGGEIAGYPSRLHYFSDWIVDNQEMGLVRDVTRELGGERDAEPIAFMSNNLEAYRQLADPANLAEIRRIEDRISDRPRYVIPESRIAQVESGIRNGDIIAATSTLPGLDVAHTGIAVWIDGRLHLMHAPLVGKSVEISELPLAERILGIRAQDGIMVARPVE